MVKLTTIAAIFAGVIGVVSGVVVIWEFWYNVDDEIFPKQDYFEISATFSEYDAVAEKITSSETLELKGQDMEILVNSLSDQIAKKLEPELPPEVPITLEITDSQLNLSQLVLLNIYIDGDSGPADRIYDQHAVNAPVSLPSAGTEYVEDEFGTEYVEDEFGSKFVKTIDLLSIYQEPFIDQDSGCVNITLTLENQYSSEHVQICKDIDSKFVIEGETKKEVVFYIIGRKSIIIEPLTTEGDGSEKIPASLLQSQIKENLKKFRYITIEENSLDEIKEKRREMREIMEPSPTKTSLFEDLGPDYILSGSIFIHSK
ncbi:MAG: hypothetical protein ACT4NT_08145 [Nitrososphaerota archaeon]